MPVLACWYLFPEWQAARFSSRKPIICPSREGWKLSSGPSISLGGGADYCPLTGGREELSKGNREGKKAKLSIHQIIIAQHRPATGVSQTCQAQPLLSRVSSSIFLIVTPDLRAGTDSSAIWFSRKNLSRDIKMVRISQGSQLITEQPTIRAVLKKHEVRGQVNFKFLLAACYKVKS